MITARQLLCGSCFLVVVTLACACPSLAQNVPSTTCCRSALNISASQSVDLLVTAPNGLRTGYDAVAVGGSIKQIPSSNYYLGLAEGVPGSAGSGQVERKIDISTPAAGRYLVQAIGVAEGAFQIEFKASDESGKETVRNFSGAAKSGSTFVYSVQYFPQPGAKFEVTALVPFASLIVGMNAESGSSPAFHLKSIFQAGPGSGGVHPASQPVFFHLAGYGATIPAGSFTAGGQGDYQFDGTLDGIHVKAVIAPEGENRFGLRVDVQGIAMNNAINPIRFLLIIGDNAGATQFNAVSQ